jgi:hypothetical protein
MLGEARVIDLGHRLLVIVGNRVTTQALEAGSKSARLDIGSACLVDAGRFRELPQ